MARSSTKSSASTTEKSLDLALSAINKQFGEGAIMKLGESKKLDVSVIPTGCPSMDLALGVGGLPRGRIAVVYGPE